MAKEQDDQFDWIDDAFDDKRTAAEMEKAKGPKLAVIAALLVFVIAVALVGFALASLMAISW